MDCGASNACSADRMNCLPRQVSSDFLDSKSSMSGISCRHGAPTNPISLVSPTDLSSSTGSATTNSGATLPINRSKKAARTPASVRLSQTGMLAIHCYV